ncbi:MAG: PAS domain S-box protein [Chloroflexi bacterium]|nr:PAS domain S-box protein [Chloroflexota bacterium]
MLRRKAAELEAVFESLADGVLVVDASSRVVEANRAMVALVGCTSKDDLLGPIAQVFYARARRADGGTLSREDIGLHRTLRDGDVMRGEALIQEGAGRPGDGGRGETCWLETIASPIRDLEGAVLGATLVARDVTDRRRHERELAFLCAASEIVVSSLDAESTLAVLAERCVAELADWCSISLRDEQTGTLRLVALQHRDARVATAVADELRKRPLALGQEFASAAIRADQTLLLPDLTDEVVKRYTRSNREAQLIRRLNVRGIISAPLRGADCAIGAISVGWAGSRQVEESDRRVVDELARRAALAIEQGRAFDALEQALERLELVLDSMAAGFLIFGGDGRSILVNAPARSMLGMEGTGLGLKIEEIIHHYADNFEDDRQVDALIASVSDRDQYGRGTFRLEAPTPLDVEWIASPVRESDGPALGQVVVWLDVTHARSVERVKDDLAADLSAALRSPLQAASTYAVQALRRSRRPGGDNQVAHALEVILRNTRQIAVLVNDLVDGARFDASELELSVHDVDAADVVQQAVDQARAMTTVHRFRLDVPAGLPRPRWDPDRARQALLHVLTNAIKFWPEGGQIGVKVRPNPEGIVISVRDRGLGIPPEEHERVFERFYRLSNDPERRRIRGNGLGLYLVQGVVQAHGGTIWIESDGLPGEGTIVHLLLPWEPSLDADA